MHSVSSLLQLLSDETLFSSLTYPDTDDEVEDLLENRDSEEFSSKWMSSYRWLNDVKASGTLDKVTIEQIDRVRELAYLQSYKRWHSPDLSGYVSDDFGVIGDMVALKVDEPWVTALFQSYLDGQVPGANC